MSANKLAALELEHRLAAAEKTIAEKDAEIEKLKSSRKFSNEFNAVRWERLKDLFKGTQYEDQFFRVMANGIASPLENPTYAQILNIKEYEIERLQTTNAVLEQKVKSLEADIYIKDERYAELSGMYEATCKHEEELETKIAILEARLKKAVEVYCDFVGHNAFFVEAINSELAAITSETIKNEGEG